jgi:hypothetical protein
LSSGLINPTNAKKRFVESLIEYSKYLDSEDFLKPVQTKDNKRDVKVKIFKDDKKFDDDEFQRIIAIIESKKMKTNEERSKLPEWAKLAVSSSQPNTKPKKYY